MALNFPFPLNATSPVPFTISVDQSFIDETLYKASLYRPTPDLLDGTNDDWHEGPPSANVTALADYWINEFDWKQEEEYINGNFSHFATTVPETELYPHPVPLHFIHERSENDDALPLILLHGWPSTSWEWHKVIPILANPTDPDTPSFHVVAPDMPGFGFSPAALYDGLSPEALAHIFDGLMAQLGYDRYGIIGTDLGFFVTMWMANVVPEGRISGHLTDFFLVNPTPEDLARYEANQTSLEETRFIGSLLSFTNDHSGYLQSHAQQPLQGAQAFADTPVGYAGWVWHLMYTVSGDYVYTFDEIISNVFHLFIQHPYAGIRYYAKFFSPEGQAFWKSDIPSAMTQFYLGGPVEELRWSNNAPRSWLERFMDIKEIYKHDAGGHFPAISYPKEWAADVAHFFGIYN